MDKNTKQLRRLALWAGIVIIGLTTAAFALSYEHLHAVAASSGVKSPIAAWAWPATVDAFIVAGELLTLRGALRGKADRFAIGITALGSIASIALNVAGVGSGHPKMWYVAAAVPPAAALIGFAAVMRQVHERLADSPADTADTRADAWAVTLATADTRAVTPLSVAAEPAPPVATPAVTAGNPQLAPVTAPATEDNGADSELSLADKVSVAVAALSADGTAVTGQMLAEHFGVSARTGRRYLADHQAATS